MTSVIFFLTFRFYFWVCFNILLQYVVLIENLPLSKTKLSWFSIKTTFYNLDYTDEKPPKHYFHFKIRTKLPLWMRFNSENYITYLVSNILTNRTLVSCVGMVRHTYKALVLSGSYTQIIMNESITLTVLLVFVEPLLVFIGKSISY